MARSGGAQGAPQTGVASARPAGGGGVCYPKVLLVVTSSVSMPKMSMAAVDTAVSSAGESLRIR
ncbi:MAG: hypothetical protein IPP97_27795 [Candidatus Obscuribacter sp.]|nr:hypothetical protein [Candidatus Obscuribacter sp.]